MNEEVPGSQSCHALLISGLPANTCCLRSSEAHGPWTRLLLHIMLSISPSRRDRARDSAAHGDDCEAVLENALEDPWAEPCRFGSGIKLKINM